MVRQQRRAVILRLWDLSVLLAIKQLTPSLSEMVRREAPDAVRE